MADLGVIKGVLHLIYTFYISVCTLRHVNMVLVDSMHQWRMSE